MSNVNVFQFRAASPDGRIDAGTIDAESNDEARAALASRGLFVLQIRDRGPRRTNRRPIASADLALGLRILSDLLDSGLPLSRALHVFEDLAPAGWQAGLPSIRESVREGSGLASAFVSAPIDIPGLVIGLTQAGEAGAGLASSIRRSAELTEAIAETRASIRAALAYPMVVAIAGATAIIVLMTVVLPRFAAILQDLGQTLPASTRLVLAVGGMARTALLPASIGLACGLVAWRGWLSRESGRRARHRLLLGVPFIGTVRRSTGVARGMHALSALLEAGVRAPAAIRLAARSTGDSELETRFMASRAALSAGEPFSRAIDSVGAVTPTVLRLIRAGEESGNLAAMLKHAARIEQQRADRLVRVGLRMLEPALLLCFASTVALVAAALLQAIYSVRPIP